MQTVSENKPSSPIQIYEIIRLVDGIPLFLEAHINRLYQSARLAAIEHLPGPVALQQMIDDFLILENPQNGNMRLTFTFASLDTTPIQEIEIIPFQYPTAEQYVDGVSCGLLHAERKNPNAKVIQEDIRAKADKLISEHSFFEIILVDHEERITEGSRSNLFFVKGNRIFTPPAEEVLAGITRQKIIQICLENDLLIAEEPISLKQLKDFDAIFISGTSPKILPVKSIENNNYNCSLPIVKRLMRLYDQSINEYTRSKKLDRNITK